MSVKSQLSTENHYVMHLYHNQPLVDMRRSAQRNGAMGIPIAKNMWEFRDVSYLGDK